MGPCANPMRLFRHPSPVSCCTGACSGQRIPSAHRLREQTVAIEDNKAIVQRYIEELWNRRNSAVAAELFTDSYTIHQGGQSIPANPEFFTQSMAIIIRGLPDLRMTIDQLVGEGDLVVANWTNRGRQTGELQLPSQQVLPPSGREVTFTESATFRIDNSRIAEVWYVSDRLTMMQQLGAISLPGQP